MVECEYAPNCSLYNSGECNELHVGCLKREIKSRFVKLRRSFEDTLAVPEADSRYILSCEAEKIFDSIMSRLEKNFGAENLGEMMRNPR